MDESKADVIVIAGTYDAGRILNELTSLNLKVAAMVNTNVGNEFIDSHPNIKFFQKKLTAHGMARVIKMFDAKCLVDVSHPYAVEAQTSAMKACEKVGIKYLRYEKTEAKIESKNIIKVKDYDEAAKQLAVIDGNILLSVGSRGVEPFFMKIQNFSSRLYIRILPDGELISRLEKMGLHRNNIIAVKGPVSEALNMEILRHIDAKVLITKDSGSVGGTEDKIRAAEKLGIKTIVIERPSINYKEKAGSITEAVFCIGNALAGVRALEK